MRHGPGEARREGWGQKALELQEVGAVDQAPTLDFPVFTGGVRSPEVTAPWR